MVANMTKEILRVNVDRESLTVNATKETLMVVKPGFEHLVGEILLGIEEAGLQATLWSEITLNKEEASQFYCQDKERPWHGKVTTYLCQEQKGQSTNVESRTTVM